MASASRVHAPRPCCPALLFVWVHPVLCVRRARTWTCLCRNAPPACSASCIIWFLFSSCGVGPTKSPVSAQPQTAMLVKADLKASERSPLSSVFRASLLPPPAPSPFSRRWLFFPETPKAVPKLRTCTKVSTEYHYSRRGFLLRQDAFFFYARTLLAQTFLLAHSRRDCSLLCWCSRERKGSSLVRKGRRENTAPARRPQTAPAGAMLQYQAALREANGKFPSPALVVSQPRAGGSSKRKPATSTQHEGVAQPPLSTTGNGSRRISSRSMSRPPVRKGLTVHLVARPTIMPRLAQWAPRPLLTASSPGEAKETQESWYSCESPSPIPEPTPPPASAAVAAAGIAPSAAVHEQHDSSIPAMFHAVRRANNSLGALAEVENSSDYPAVEAVELAAAATAAPAAAYDAAADAGSVSTAVWCSHAHFIFVFLRLPHVLRSTKYFSFGSLSLSIFCLRAQGSYDDRKRSTA